MRALLGNFRKFKSSALLETQVNALLYEDDHTIIAITEKGHQTKISRRVLSSVSSNKVIN